MAGRIGEGRLGTGDSNAIAPESIPKENESGGQAAGKGG